MVETWTEDELVTVLHEACHDLDVFQKTFMTVPRYGLGGIKVCETASCRSLDAHPPDRLDQGNGNHGCSWGVERGPSMESRDWILTKV